MLVKPDLDEDLIVGCLREQYGLAVGEVAFLPVGADVNAASYRAAVEDGLHYFVKLRRGAFDEVAVALPHCLRGQGVRQVMAPVATRGGRLSARLAPFAVVLYPFVEGRDAYEAPLSEAQCVELGTALRAIHSASVPPELLARIPRESYTPRWRDRVRQFVIGAEAMEPVDSVAAAVLALLVAEQQRILDLVGRAAALAGSLRAGKRGFVVCHADVHAGNIFLSGDGSLYIVDWDAPILAPRERDLMYAGGGLLGGWHTAGRCSTGATVTWDRHALAYYRCERVVQDIAEFCEQLLLTPEGGEDREQSLGYLRSNFEPGSVLEIAERTGR